MAAALPLEEQIYKIVSRTSDDSHFARSLSDDQRVARVARILMDEDYELQRHRQLLQATMAAAGGKLRFR